MTASVFYLVSIVDDGVTGGTLAVMSSIPGPHLVALPSIEGFSQFWTYRHYNQVAQGTWAEMSTQLKTEIQRINTQTAQLQDRQRKEYRKAAQHMQRVHQASQVALQRLLEKK